MKAICSGEFAVFRISFALVLFFGVHLLLSFRCCGPTTFRLGFQTSFFCVKALVFILLVVVSFFIPNVFFQGFGYICAAGGGLYLVIQMILILDFCYRWNDSWTSKAAEANEGEQRTWLVLLFGSCLIIFSLGVSLCGVMYAWFKSEDLFLAFITITLISGIVCTALSIKLPYASILPATAIFLYTSALTFSAISSGSQHCTPLAPSPSFSPDLPTAPVALSPLHKISPTTSLVLSSIFCGFSLLWSCVKNGANRHAFVNSDDEEDDEESTSHFTFFHFVMTLGSCYMAMLLTSWHLSVPGDVSHSESADCIDSGKTAMWIKISAEWLTILGYFWTLIAPKIFPNRDWGFDVDV